MRTQYDEADVRRVFEKMATKIAGSFLSAAPLSLGGIRRRTQYAAPEARRPSEKLPRKIPGSFWPDAPLSVVGIRTRGETLAERLSDFLKKKGLKNIGRGVLNITLYRDALSEVGPKPMV